MNKLTIFLLWVQTKVEIKGLVVYSDGVNSGHLQAVHDRFMRVCREYTGQQFDTIVNSYRYKAYIGSLLVGTYSSKKQAAKAIFYKLHSGGDDVKSAKRINQFQKIIKKY